MMAETGVSGDMVREWVSKLLKAIDFFQEGLQWNEWGSTGNDLRDWKIKIRLEEACVGL